jgi:2'-5' RNA ligase
VSSRSDTRDDGTRSGPLRVFFAAWPDAPTCDAVAALAHDVAIQAGGKPPRLAAIHLTLAFVGNVPPARIALLHEIGAAVSRAATPVALVLDQTGGFRDAGIAWLGTKATPPGLEELVGALRRALATAGFPIDARAFRVHVTLARRCRKRVHAATVATIVWRVDRMTLTASDLGSDGSRYHDIAAWPLGAASE